MHPGWTQIDSDAEGGIAVMVAPGAGGRLASLEVAGTPVLVTAARAGVDPDDMSDPVAAMQWGSFPMAPWAGRIRHGRFHHEGTRYDLPRDLPPHAIHGTTYRRPWTVTSSDATSVTLRTNLAWPLGGWARQHLALSGSTLRCELEVTAADRSMPAQVGWHPWFVKPSRARLRFAAMYARDEEGIPTGELVAPGEPGTLDDCLVDPLATPLLVIPGRRGTPAVEVEIESDCRHMVVYDRPDHGTCVEPQSGPPDAANAHPLVLGPGESLRRSFILHLRSLPAD